LLTLVTAVNGTDSAPRLSDTELVPLLTPVAVPVTVKGSAVAVPLLPCPITATVYAPSGTVAPLESLPFQFHVLLP
jgi:hypothetical protein